jgi:hypothetical protein
MTAPRCSGRVVQVLLGGIVTLSRRAIATANAHRPGVCFAGSHGPRSTRTILAEDRRRVLRTFRLSCLC